MKLSACKILVYEQMIVLTIFLSSCCELTCLIFCQKREEKYTKISIKTLLKYSLHKDLIFLSG